MVENVEGLVVTPKENRVAQDVDAVDRQRLLGNKTVGFHLQQRSGLSICIHLHVRLPKGHKAIYIYMQARAEDFKRRGQILNDVVSPAMRPG